MASKQWLLPLRFSILIILLLIFSLVFSFLAARFQENTKPTLTEPQPPFSTVILDAGHGGEDGGATGVSGVLEKELNLAVAEKTAALFRLLDFDVTMTRESDISLGEDAPKGKRKMTDLKKRLDAANARPDAIFLSIHMNKFEQSQYHGAQVFYASTPPDSRLLGDCLQNKLIEIADPDNNRIAKQGDKSIFILKNSSVPSVIVECGFLSNPSEEQMLNTDSYKEQIAYSLYHGICDYFDKQKTDLK